MNAMSLQERIVTRALLIAVKNTMRDKKLPKNLAVSYVLARYELDYEMTDKFIDIILD